MRRSHACLLYALSGALALARFRSPGSGRSAQVSRATSSRTTCTKPSTSSEGGGAPVDERGP